MGYRVLCICASLSGNLIKVMCKAPAIWVEDTYIFLKLSQCFFSFLIPNSFVLQSGWKNSRKTSTTLFCNKCHLNCRWINKNLIKDIVFLCVCFFFFLIHAGHRNDRCQNENVSIYSSHTVLFLVCLSIEYFFKSITIFLA